MAQEPIRAWTFLNLELALFQYFRDAPEEGIGSNTIDDAVIVGQRHVHNRVDGHDVFAVRAIDDHHTFDDLAHTQNTDVGLIDDRAAKEIALKPWIRNRERCAREIVCGEFACACAFRQLVDGAGDAANAKLIRTSDNGDHETIRRVDGDAHMIVRRRNQKG